MDDQIFKNQYTLERMIVWLINPLEFNLRQFSPSEKMIPEKMLESATPKKVNSENLPPGKIYLKIETPGKKSQSRDSLDCYIHTPVRIKNGIVHFHMHSKSQFRGSGTVGVTF